MDDDYLALIKNPKPKSPRLPTGPLKTSQRQSPSSPNAASSPSVNLSSLNRPMAANPYVQPTNIFNPQPLSRRSSQVGSPLDRSTDSFVRRSTPSFIGETTSQIVSRPDGMERSSSMLRSQTGSARAIRDMDYDGLGRVSQVTRRTQISPDEKSPTFREHNEGLRNSMVRSRRVERKKKGVDWPVVVLGAIGTVIAFLVLRSIFPSRIVYCDTGDLTSGKDCVPCPPHGICHSGKLVRCEEGLTLHNDQCILKLDEKLRFGQYRKHINHLLTNKKGEKLCNDRIRDELTLAEIIEELNRKFADEGLKNSLIFESQWRSVLEDGKSDIVYDSKSQTYKTLDTPTPSLTCKMSLLWSEGKLFGLWIALFIATVIVLVKFLITRVVYTNLAVEVYTDVLEYLSYWQKTTVKTLKREFEYKYPDKDFDRLWHYVEELVLKGGRVNRYFDYYRDEKQVQEFWALLY